MAPEVQRAPDPVMDLLASEPWAWNFLEAVRHIECLCPQHPRIGTSRHPSEDPVRFGQEPSLAFPPSSIAGSTKPDV
mgnify:CR=1 FL=1